MERFNAIEAGLVQGDTLQLVNDDAIEMRFDDVLDEEVTLLVLGEEVARNLTPRQATDMGKRIANPNYSKNTGFPTAREWKFNDIVIGEFINENTMKVKGNPTGARGSEGRGREAKTVRLPICETHFVEISATGVCFWCE